MLKHRANSFLFCLIYEGFPLQLVAMVFLATGPIFIKLGMRWTYVTCVFVFRLQLPILTGQFYSLDSDIWLNF